MIVKTPSVSKNHAAPGHPWGSLSYLITFLESWLASLKRTGHNIPSQHRDWYEGYFQGIEDAIKLARAHRQVAVSREKRKTKEARSL